jgi:hypothetical protein
MPETVHGDALCTCCYRVAELEAALVSTAVDDPYGRIRELEEAIASAMTSLATDPASTHCYPYKVLDEALTKKEKNLD